MKHVLSNVCEIKRGFIHNNIGTIYMINIVVVISIK